MQTIATLTVKPIRIPRSSVGRFAVSLGIRDRFCRFVERGDWEDRCFDHPALDRCCLTVVVLAFLYFSFSFLVSLLS